MAMASKKKTVKHWDNLVLNIKELIENVKSMKTSQFFKEPVDEVRDGAKDYYAVIKNPMDLSTMLNKLRNHQYYRPTEVLEDFKLICRNCREYNMNPENPIRKICDKFEAVVLKKWEENTQALLSCDVDLENAVFDYNLVDQGKLNTDKINKEQKSLMQTTPAFQKAPSYTDYSAPSYSTDYYDPYGAASQPALQKTSSQVSGRSSQPASYGADSGNMLNSYNSQGSRPAQNPYGIQANPVPQPTQNAGYQAPTYQPTYQPQYRPSYTSSAKPTSSQPAPAAGSFGGAGGENSLKINLSSMMKKTEPAKEGGDIAPASNFPDFSDFSTGQADFTNNGTYYNPASVRYDEPAPAPASKPYDPYQPPKAEKNEDERLFGALMKEFGSNGGTFDDDMSLKFESNTAASEGQKTKKEYGAAPEFSTDFFASEPAKPKEDPAFQVTLPKPAYNGSGEQAKKPQSSGGFKPEVKTDSGIVKIPKDVLKKDPDSSKPDQHKSSDPLKSSAGSSSITIKKDGGNQIRLENKPKPLDKPREPRPEGGEIRKDIKKEPSDKIRPPGYDQSKNRDDRDRQPSDKRPSSDVKRDSMGKPESSKRMEVEPPKSSSGQNIISIKPPSSLSKGDPQKGLVRSESDKRPDKPSSSDKPRPDRPPGSSGLSSSSQSSERKDKDKFSSGGLSLGSKSGSDKTFPTPASKKMETEGGDKIILKKPVGGDVKRMEVEKKKPVENGPKAEAAKDNKDDNDLDFNDLIAEYMSLNQEKKSILKFNEAVSPTGQPSDTEAETKMDESFEKADKDEIKPPKVSIKRDKEKDKDKRSSMVPGSDRERERDRDRSEDGKKKSGSNKSKSRTDEVHDGEFLYQESHYKEDPSSSRIRFDKEAMKRDYETFARMKVPKYIKKFQKHIKRLGTFFTELEIQDEVLVKLKEEVEHLNLTDRSLNYSRVLLYLFNLLVFLKYQHEMNKHKFSKKIVKRIISVAKKSFAYLKEVLKLQYIKFSDEETEAFDKSAKEYRTALHAQVKQFRDFKAGIQPPSLTSKSSRHEVHSIDTGVLTGEMPRKITIIQSGDGEPKVSHKSSHHGKKDTSMKVKILPPQAKKQPKLETAPKEETEEDRIKKEMSKYLTEIRNEFEAKNFVEAIDKNISKSWKVSEELEKGVEMDKKLSQMQEEGEAQTAQTAEPSHMEVEKESADESDNIFPTTSLPISFSLAPSEKKNKMFMGATRGFDRRPSPKRPSAFKFEEEKPAIEGPLWRPQPSLFQRDRQVDIFHVRYAPGMNYIDGNLKINLKNSFLSKGSPMDKKITFRFFTNKLDEVVKAALAKKGYEYLWNPPVHHDLFLNKLVWIKVWFKQLKDRNYLISERQNTINVALKNPMTIEAFDKMQHLEDERIKNEIRIKDYDVLLPLAHIKEIMQENEFITKLSHAKWKFRENLALFHNCETKDDEKEITCTVTMLALIEDFSEFKLDINQIPIL